MFKPNKFLIVIIVIIVGITLVGLVKDQLIKSVINLSATKILGTKTEVKVFSLRVIGQSISMKDFKIYNPSEFGTGIMLDIPEISVKYDLGALLKRKLHLRLIRLNLKEMHVVKNKDGKLNVDSLKIAEPAPGKAAKQAPQKKPSEPLQMQIDVATLTIGKVIFTDYSRGATPIVQVFDVNIKDRTYKNITSAQQFAAIVMVEAMKPTAIKGAGIYGAAALAGTALLPVGAVVLFTGKDSAEGLYSASFEKVYNTTIEVLSNMGKITSENKTDGLIKASASGHDVTVKISKTQDRKIQVLVSARKLLMPKVEFASGVIYQISEKLK